MDPFSGSNLEFSQLLPLLFSHIAPSYVKFFVSHLYDLHVYTILFLNWNMIHSLFSQTISKDLLNRYKNIFITVFKTFQLFKLINMSVSSKLVYEIVLKVFLILCCCWRQQLLLESWEKQRINNLRPQEIIYDISTQNLKILYIWVTFYSFIVDNRCETHHPHLKINNLSLEAVRQAQPRIFWKKIN
jgi:hypothetical protein